MRKNSKLCKVLQTQWVWGTGKTSSLMGSWRETQLKWHRNNKPHFAWIPHSSEQGEKDGKEGQMRSPLTKSIIFKKFYQSTPQTPKPGFRPRPRAVSGNSHILYIPEGPHPPGLTAELSASCMGGWWGQSQRGFSFHSCEIRARSADSPAWIRSSVSEQMVRVSPHSWDAVFQASTSKAGLSHLIIQVLITKRFSLRGGLLARSQKSYTTVLIPVYSTMDSFPLLLRTFCFWPRERPSLRLSNLDWGCNQQPQVLTFEEGSWALFAVRVSG